jgi:hypothetical protein
MTGLLALVRMPQAAQSTRTFFVTSTTAAFATQRIINTTTLTFGDPDFKSDPDTKHESRDPLVIKLERELDEPRVASLRGLIVGAAVEVIIGCIE